VMNTFNGVGGVGKGSDLVWGKEHGRTPEKY